MSTKIGLKTAVPPLIPATSNLWSARINQIAIEQNLIRNVDTPILGKDAANKDYVDNNTGNPANPNTSIQFNNNGTFGGTSSLTWDGTNVNISNGIVSGQMYLNNFPISNNDAANKAYVDSQATDPEGPNNSVQYNNSGTFGGSSDFYWNNSTKFLTVNGQVALPNAPINPTDAANKAYVDSNTGSPGGPFNSLQYNDGGTMNGSADLEWNNGTKVLGVNGVVNLPNISASDPGTYSANKNYVDSAIGSSAQGPAQAVQYNSDPAGNFEGSGDFTWDQNNTTLSIGGTIVADSYVTSSDTLLKTNINHLQDPLSRLRQIEGFSYNLKNKPDEVFGVLAQNLENSGMGHMVQEINGYKRVDYTQFIPLLIEGVKELALANASNASPVTFEPVKKNISPKIDSHRRKRRRSKPTLKF